MGQLPVRPQAERRHLWKDVREAERGSVWVGLVRTILAELQMHPGISRMRIEDDDCQVYD